MSDRAIQYRIREGFICWRRLLSVERPMLELYRLPGCPYCAKVERKLDEWGLEYEQHNVLPFRFLRFEVKSISTTTSAQSARRWRFDGSFSRGVPDVRFP
ncbi:glutaredoxin family protein [Salinigranum halophilum]|uniref:glutaredoxin family protein n=1 Tax=Salinigranum halophilum TaxID=2565931 RepID=UPI0037442557